MTDVSKPPEILAIKTVAKTRVFQIEQVTLKFSNQQVREFERLKMWEPGIVVVVPVTAEREVLLVQEYAAGINDYHLSLPKGKVEAGEEILVAANRELQEEVGVKAQQLRYVTAMTNGPGYSPTQTHVVLAEGLTPSKLPADEPEPLLVQRWPLSDIAGLMARDDFHDGRAIAALFLVKETLLG